MSSSGIFSCDDVEEMVQLVHNQDAYGHARIDVDGNQDPYAVGRLAGDVSDSNSQE